MNSGGAQRQMLNLVMEHESKGYPYLLVIYNSIIFYKEFYNLKNTLIYNEPNKLKLISTLYLLLKREAGPKFIFVSFLFGPSSIALILKFIFLNKMKWVYGIRNILDKNLCKRCFELLFMVFSDVIISNSNYSVNNLKFLFKKKIHVIWNGFYVDKISSQSLISSRSHLRFLYIGRLNEQKNLNVMIKAIIKFSTLTSTKIILDIYGREDWILSRNKKEFDELITAKYRFLNIFYKGESHNIINGNISYDLMLLTSIHEGFPNVVCESMFYKIPVLVSNVADNNLMIGTDRGYLTGISEESIIISLLKWKYDEEKFNKANNAFTFAQNNFNIKVVFEKYEICYKKVINIS